MVEDAVGVDDVEVVSPEGQVLGVADAQASAEAFQGNALTGEGDPN